MINQILDIIYFSFSGEGAVVVPKDFFHLGSRQSVYSCLSYLTSIGILQRLTRGMYYYPLVNQKLGIEIPPHEDDIIGAVSRQESCNIYYSKAKLDNLMGKSRQVPAKLVYETTGKTRTLKIGNRTFYFINTFR